MPDPLSMALIGSSVIGAGSQIFGAQSAASAQKDAAAKASDTQAAMYQAGLAQQRGMFDIGKATEQPFIDWGKQAFGPIEDLTNPLTKLITPGPDMTKTLEQTPGYKFALSQGEKGITNQATMRGLSGNALREGSTFAEGLAQGTWKDVINSLIAGIQPRLQQAGIGANAANSVMGNATSIGNTALGAATGTGASIGQNIIGAGNAAAGANVASGNAIASAGSNITQLYALDKLTGGKLFGATGGAWAPGG